MIVGNIWQKPVLTYASSVCGTAGVGEYGFHGGHAKLCGQVLRVLRRTAGNSNRLGAATQP